ncbi:uncharacterized protein BT62DRAFT_920293 [Guyanagaster necrorhizus]|uniref:Uncharacterized protein n=1 Tax=Guyanagaster necrorhizus TaxID=856835 RepID=A0A9P8ARY7_9AGAR|nr:uncharacterized protein BT62DRAFT_920293 [Guyanagaster necrorhizus MCA 3950]KAG7445580.1 hypothetical protein BT62DRAFT_920293 [Guyanagaster necrorhizus MCA 3950]
MQCVGINTLPQELIDAIIDENQDDQAALRACSLVARPWTYSSQRHIFSRVHFRNHSQQCYYPGKLHKTSCDISRFHDLISMRPHLTSFVRTLQVEPILDAAQEQLLASTLQRLVNLECISLDLGGYYWDELSQCMRDALITTFRSPRITNLELREGLFLRSADFLALLGACEHLKRLSLSAMSCDDLEEFVQADTAALTLPCGLNLQLDSLALSLYEQSYLPLMHRLLQLQPSMDLSHLHRLSVLTAGSGHLSERIEATKEILKLNSNSLRHLVLNVCLGEPLSNLIDIKRLLSIQIKLWWIRLDQHTEPTLWLRWLIESFQDLAKHRVEEVTFEIFYNSDWTAYTAEWAALDAVLGEMRSLTKVHVKLDAYDDVRGRWKLPREYSLSAAKDVERILPTVCSRKILACQFAANFPW